jgi:acyl-CoA synthetase (AMP-forming)/AMP-acid ligase II
VTDTSGKQVDPGQAGGLIARGANVMRGYWNNPEDEAVIYRHPAVREVAVFGIPDPQWGELVMACVVLRTGETLTADDLIAFCRRSLASYKIPRRIEFSETDLPKNSSGKVMKKTLREHFWMHQQHAVS